MPSSGADGPNDTAAAIISSTTPISDIITILAEQQCPDITHRLDLENCESAPVAWGGSGAIYRGALDGGELVAIKCVKHYVRRTDINGHKILKQAARELHAWSRFHHDNLVELRGLALFRDHLAMISPWMENGTLLEFLHCNPTTDRYQLIVGITNGVAYLHHNDAIHGDIKSGNILVSREGVAKLADFGCTEILSSSLEFSATTNVQFSTRWAALEILTGGERSKKADVYALGMTLWEVIAGKIPFDDLKKGLAVAVARLTTPRQTPERPESFPSFKEHEANILWDMITSCWENDSLLRPESHVVRDRVLGIRS